MRKIYTKRVQRPFSYFIPCSSDMPTAEYVRLHFIKNNQFKKVTYIINGKEVIA